MPEVNPKRRNIIWTSILVVVVLGLLYGGILFFTPVRSPQVVVANNAPPLPSALLPQCSEEVKKCQAFAASLGVAASPCDTIRAGCLK